MSSQKVTYRWDHIRGWVRDDGSEGMHQMALYAFVGLVGLIIWRYVRFMLRGLFDIVNQITMFILEQHLYLFIFGGGLLFLGICILLVGRKPLVRIWPMVLGSMILGSLFILLGYWANHVVELPGQLAGQYVRSDRKARLTIKGDSIHIWSGKKHLTGRCEFMPCFSRTAIKTRITGFPLSGAQVELFTLSIEDINGETIYQLEPTGNSLLIHADGKTIQYGRIMR